MSIGLGSVAFGRGRPRPSRRARAADAFGLTLIEVVVAVAILGLVSTAMSAALFVMIRTGDVQRRDALADSELRRYTDWLAAQPYQDCVSASSSGQYGTSAYSASAGTSAQITRVQFSSIDYSATGTFGTPTFVDTSPGCGGAPPRDTGMQQLRVQVTATSGADPSTRTATVSKRRDG